MQNVSGIPRGVTFTCLKTTTADWLAITHAGPQNNTEVWSRRHRLPLCSYMPGTPWWKPRLKRGLSPQRHQTALMPASFSIPWAMPPKLRQEKTPPGYLARQILLIRPPCRAPMLLRQFLFQRPSTSTSSQTACLGAYENAWCFKNVLLCCNPPLKLMFLIPGAAAIASQPSAPAGSYHIPWLNKGRPQKAQRFSFRRAHISFIGLI